ncbi:MAG: S-layer homology domain-containing protein [Eubacteriales bacterium]
MKTKKLIITIITAFLLLALTSFGLSAFDDVFEYHEAIGLLSDVGVIRGYSASLFGPEDGVTRWQMALLISKLMDGNVDTAYWQADDTSAAFTDLNPAKHYLRAISYASDKGIIKGRSATVFDPDSGITLQDGATMAVRALGYPAGDYDAEYPRSYMIKAEELGLFSGVIVGGRAPNSYDGIGWDTPLTRGQTAQLLYNTAFAETYGGGCYIVDVFDYRSETAVLAATADFRINSSVGYAINNELVFMNLQDDGTLKNSFRIPESAVINAIGGNNCNDYVGAAFKIVTSANRSSIFSMYPVSASTSLTTGLVSYGDDRIAIYDESYTVVSAYTLPREYGVKPLVNEIIIYAGCDASDKTMKITSGSVLNAQKVAQSCAYYELTAFDDNADGLPDRAVYRPYTFAEYKVNTDGSLALAQNNFPLQINIINKSGAEPKNGDYVRYWYDSQTKTLSIAEIYTVRQGIRLISFTQATDSSEAFIKYDNNETMYIGRQNYLGADGAAAVSALKSAGNLSGRLADVVLDSGRIILIKVYDKTTSLSGVTHYTDAGVVIKTVTGSELSAIAVCLNTDDENKKLDIISVDDAASASNITTGDFVEYELDGSGVKLIKRNDQITYSSATTNARLKADGNVFTVTENGVVFYSVPINANTKFITYDDNLTPRVIDYSQFSDNLTGYKAIYVSISGKNGNCADLVYVRKLQPSLFGGKGNEFSNIVWIAQDSLSDHSIGIFKSSSGDEYYAYTGTDILTGNARQKAYKLLTPGTRLTKSGYYRVINDYLISTEPVDRDLSNQYLTLYQNMEITSSIPNGAGGYDITIGRTYPTQPGGLSVYERTSAGLSDITGTIDAQNIALKLNGKRADLFYQSLGYTGGIYYYRLILIIR